METKEILAWHFLRGDKKLGYEDKRIVALGETITVEPDKLEMCKFGLHGSKKILDALSFVYWENAIACRVKLGGRVIEKEDKIVASERTVISWFECARILHEFAYRVGEDVLPIFEKTYPKEDRPRKAIEAKRLWLDGKISIEDLHAASDAAFSATVTLRNCTAWYAWYATRGSPLSTWYATWYAAWYAWTGAGADTAWFGAKDKYNRWLEEMVLANM